MTAPVLPFPLPGCRVDAVRTDAPVLLIEAHTTTPTALCPDCPHPSTRVHSRYTRLLRDLPVTTQAVRLLLRVRRFLCPTLTCPRRTFAERLPDLAPFRAQRTERLTHSLRSAANTVPGLPICCGCASARIHCCGSFGPPP